MKNSFQLNTVYQLYSIRSISSLFILYSLFCFSYSLNAQNQNTQDQYIDELSALSKEEPQKAIDIIDSLNIEEYFSRDSTTYYKLNAIKAKANRNIGNYDSSMKLYSQNFQYYEKVKDSLALANAADQIGTIHIYQGDVDKAQDFYIIALKLYEKVGSEKDLANIYNGFAGLFSYLGENEKSLEYLHKGMLLYETIKDTLGQANLWANIGFIHMEMGDFDAAESSFRKQFRLDSLIDSQWGIGYYYDYMGDLRRYQERYREAIENYKKALEIRGALTNSFNLAATKITMAETLIEIGEHNEARKYLSEVLSQSKEHDAISVMQQIYKLNALSFKKQGAYKESLENYEKYKEVSDSIFNKNKVEAFAEKDAKYEVSKKEAEVKTLKLEDKLNRSRISQQRWTISGLGLGLGIVSLLGYFLYNQKNKITEQNLLISKSAAEKDILLREIHHRVKNNLQVVSSLLGIQGRGIKDQKAKDAIQEGQNRVQSMSLIHQNLYKKDNLTGIGMRPYIDKLSNHLLNTYQVESGEIKIDTDIEEITLDVETVVPIGLIINELISNALKYAFPGGKNGTIKISLKETDSQLLLLVQDDGVGLNEDQLKMKADSFGHSLIRAFKSKLNANVEISGNMGTQVSLLIKNYKKV